MQPITETFVSNEESRLHNPADMITDGVSILVDQSFDVSLTVTEMLNVKGNKVDLEPLDDIQFD